jgi:hypothetical protein
MIAMSLLVPQRPLPAQNCAPIQALVKRAFKILNWLAEGWDGPRTPREIRRI